MFTAYRLVASLTTKQTNRSRIEPLDSRAFAIILIQQTNKEDFSIMSLTPDLVRASLRKHLGWMSPWHEEVVKGLQADGLLNDGSVSAAAATVAPAGFRFLKTPIEAAATSPEHASLLKQVRAQAGRLGFQFSDDEQVDVNKLDAALAGKDPQQRLVLKSMMAKLRLIP